MVRWTRRAPGWGRLGPARISCPRGRRGLRGQGRPQAAAQRCAAALTPEGRPRTLARRVPRPTARQPYGEGERRRSRLLLVLGRAAAGPRSRGVLSRQRPLVIHRGYPAQRRVPAVVVVVLDPGRDPGPGDRPGREVLDAPQLEFQGRVPRFDDGVIQRRPGPAHRLGNRKPLAGGPEQARGVLAALVGVEDDAG